MMKLALAPFVFALVAGLGLARARTQTAQPQPDVFLITIDTLRADHVHCFGDQDIQTPALDQLCQDGIRFTQAFTPSPITNTSHVTIMTGLLPSAHGVTEFGMALSAQHRTLAELLKQQGYKTGAFIGSVILDSKVLAPGLDRGFDFYDNFPAHSVSKSRWGRVERRGMDVVQHAEAWLNAHPQGPHFVWIHLYDPHDPYEPPPPYSQIYKTSLYDGEIAYADSALGNFLSYLKKRGWYGPSLVILTGDHGEGLGEHNEGTHGIFLYDSTTHVPLLIKLPASPIKNRAVGAQVRTTDILPTIVDLLGLTSDAPFDGKSLRPLFDGMESSERVLFSETDYPLSFGWAPLRSVREAGFKFIEAPRPEFYDLHSDSKEVTSNYQPWSPEVLKMRAELAKLRQMYPGVKDQSPGAVGEGTTNELRALGYLRPADSLTSTNVPEPALLPDPKDKIVEFNLLHGALLAVEAQRFAEARDFLSQVLQMDPQSSFALTQLAELDFKAKNYAAAAGYWKRAAALRPKDANLLLNYGGALEVLGDTQQAQQVLQASLEIDPAQYRARYLLGDVYFCLHDLKSAADQFEAAILLQPTFEANLKLAEVLLADKQYTEALAHLKELATCQPRNADVYDQMAKAYAGLKQPEAAQQAQSRANGLRAQKNAH